MSGVGVPTWELPASTFIRTKSGSNAKTDLGSKKSSLVATPHIWRNSYLPEIKKRTGTWDTSRWGVRNFIIPTNWNLQGGSPLRLVILSICLLFKRTWCHGPQLLFGLYRMCWNHQKSNINVAEDACPGMPVTLHSCFLRRLQGLVLRRLDHGLFCPWKKKKKKG